MKEKNVVVLGEGKAAEDLAARLDVPCTSDHSSIESGAFLLSFDQNILVLSEADQPDKKLKVDWSEWWTQLDRTAGFSRKSLLSRALGLSSSKNKLVWDMTAGLGRDSLTMAGMGVEVVSIERDPVVFELLKNAQERALDSGIQSLCEAVARIRVFHSDSETYMQKNSVESPDIIFLDPMFPPKKKTALPKKEMQILQNLLGVPEDPMPLLRGAILRARERVVMKRSPSSPEIEKTSHSFTGKSVRFDMFLCNNS